MRGNFVRAAKLTFDAYKLSRSPTQRQRMLANIAASLIRLGLYEPARDTYLVLATSAREHSLRWVARVNLLEIESLVGDRVAFERHARALKSASLPPHITQPFLLTIGEGLHRFGDSAAGREYVSRALAIASEHGLNHYLFESEFALRTMRVEQPPTSTRKSAALKRIASTIDQMTRRVLTDRTRPR